MYTPEYQGSREQEADFFQECIKGEPFPASTKASY